LDHGFAVADCATPISGSINGRLPHRRDTSVRQGRHLTSNAIADEFTIARQPLLECAHETSLETLPKIPLPVQI